MGRPSGESVLSPHRLAPLSRFLVWSSLEGQRADPMAHMTQRLSGPEEFMSTEV